jgi:ribosomal protein S18 acetylase RimI-like enzyme
MARLPRSEVTLAPLATVPPEAVAQFIEIHGVARYLTERPYLSGSPGGYLVRRILEDADFDDAVALAALREGAVVGLVVIRYPKWDKEHFGFVVGRLEHIQGVDEEVLRLLVDETVNQLRARGVHMCSARLSNDALTALQLLETSGFRYIELTLDPWRDLSTWEPRAVGGSRPTRTGDVDRLCAIARSAFRTDRFHRDPRFGRAAADGVYEKWIRTWHADSSANQHSRVLIHDDEVAGFFMFELFRPFGAAGQTVMRIVLNGVEPSKARTGVGFRMYCEALDEASDAASSATTTVAAANPAVINLYAKLGFRVTSSGEVTMHWWAED